jgi:hypothetical protein
MANIDKAERSEWQKSPPEVTPFYPCWVTNGVDVFMATWRHGEWRIGSGLAYTANEITHYQLLKAPPLLPKKGNAKIGASHSASYGQGHGDTVRQTSVCVAE